MFPLNRGWLYGDAALPGSADPDFDDSGFERVTVPHANRTFPWHGFDDRDYQFVSVYRRHFVPPEAQKDSRIFVDFEGVMAAATVTLNGETLGEHCGGYTPFSFELTGAVRWGEDNVLAVVVDSTEREDIPRKRFPNLPHPPYFFSTLSGIAPWRRIWGDLRIDGFLGHQKIKSRTFSSKGVDQRFHVELDDEELLGDGIDATRAILIVTDEYDNLRPFATGVLELSLEGPGEIVGEHPFALVGGAGAVWLKAGEVETDRTILLRVRHPVLGTKTISLRVVGVPKEIAGEQAREG